MFEYSVKNLFQKEDGSSETIAIDADLTDFELTEAILGQYLQGHLMLYKLEESIVASGEFKSGVNLICDRCLDNFDTEVVFSFEREFILDRKDMTIDNLYVDKYLKVNLDESFREEILLNIDTQNICKKTCKGICLTCGVDLNLEVCLCKEVKKD